MLPIILLALLAGTLYTLKNVIALRRSIGHERLILLLEVQGPHRIEAFGKQICKPHDRGRHKWD